MMNSMSLSESPSVSPPLPGRVRPPSLIRLQRLVDLPTRWTVLALGLWVLFRTRDQGDLVPAVIVTAGYALVTIGLTAFWLSRSGAAAGGPLLRRIAYVSYLLDVLFVCALIWRDGGLGSPLYILLVLLALKAVGVSGALPLMMWLPFASGPLYVGALWFASGNLGFLTDAGFVSRYVLLWAWLIGIVFLGYELATRTRQSVALDAVLVQQQAALAQKTEVLQRTATDLGDRLLELRALQEVARALATTLRTEETLPVVVETLARMTGSSHCAVALIDRDSAAAAREGAALEGALLSDDLAEPEAFRLPLNQEPSTAEACASSRPLLVAGGPGGSMGERLGGHPYFVTPLLSRGHPIGALYVAQHPGTAARPTAAASLDTSEQFLTSFGYFAATAMENARLYDDAYEKRRELEAVLSGIGDGVVVADTDLALVLMNPVARDILGLEAEPPGGAPLRPYLSVPAFAELLGRTLESSVEQIRELELPVVRQPHGATGDRAAVAESIEGESRTYGVLASPVLDAAGEVSGVVAVLRDVTAQKEVERMKSNFLSVVSHELRTPLHSIKGFVEIILMGKTGPVTDIQEDFLKTVRSQTTVLQRMIDDLLEFSRMEAGRIRLNLEEVSLAALAQGVATKLSPLAEEGGHSLYLDFPEELPAIDGDRVRLEQVLTNLVENAIKFTPDRGEITIGGWRNGAKVCLTVHDTGIGIPPAEQEKVFDRFYQVDSSERRAYRGTGLGLSICRHIVERHHGRIWVESDGVDGHGSTFFVELPVELKLAEAPTIDFSTPSR